MVALEVEVVEDLDLEEGLVVEDLEEEDLVVEGLEAVIPVLVVIVIMEAVATAVGEAVEAVDGDGAGLIGDGGE